MSRLEALLRIVVILFAMIGIVTIGEAIDDTPGMSTVGQIAVFIGILLMIWLVERSWRGSRPRD